MRGGFLTFLVIVGLVAIGVLGQMGMFARETPRYEPQRPQAPQPRRRGAYRRASARPSGLRRHAGAQFAAADAEQARPWAPPHA